jgi:hypothetical protein
VARPSSPECAATSKAHISFKVIPACPNIVVGFLFAPLTNRPTDSSAFEDSSIRDEKKPISTGSIISSTKLRPASDHR